MAGYLMTLNKSISLVSIIEKGVFSTIMSPPRYSNWGIHHEGTFADYFSMKERDRVFFFSERKIYGCGQLLNIGSDCKYLNYEQAGNPKGDPSDNYKKTHLLEDGDSRNRCFCTFVPFPAFF